MLCNLHNIYNEHNKKKLEEYKVEKQARDLTNLSQKKPNEKSTQDVPRPSRVHECPQPQL